MIIKNNLKEIRYTFDGTFVSGKDSYKGSCLWVDQVLILIVLLTNSLFPPSFHPLYPHHPTFPHNLITYFPTFITSFLWHYCYASVPPWLCWHHSALVLLSTFLSICAEGCEESGDVEGSRGLMKCVKEARKWVNGIDRGCVDRVCCVDRMC